MLNELMETAQIHPRQLDVIGFAAGPGSFTGIRISAAVTQALALGADARVVSLESSLLLAHAARRQGLVSAQGTSQVQSVLRSRKNFAYLSSFCCSPSGEFERLTDDVLMTDDVLHRDGVPKGAVRVMDAAEEDAALLGAMPTTVDVRDLLDVSAQKLRAGETLPPEGAQPRYVEGDTPWIPR